MDKQIIKQAFAEAEKDRQEKEIKKIKNIVQSYLESIQEKTEKRKDLDDQIQILKKDLDDLKAGRLDKIEERQAKDERARQVSIIIVKRVEKEYIPYQPWRSPWVIEYRNYPNTWTTISGDITATNTISPYVMNATYTDSNQLYVTGTLCSSFASGTYEVGDKIINI